MRVVIDHLTGARRGQRQELTAASKLTIGRHPDCDISFDLRRDIEASTRHAELCLDDGELYLRDIGSSNGTYVDGDRVGEVQLTQDESTEVTFGEGGPKLSIWWHATTDGTPVPPVPPSRPFVHRPRAVIVAIGLFCLVAGLGVAIVWAMK